VTEVVGTFRRAIDALEKGVNQKVANELAAIAEGGRETTGAYRKGWR
jgi:putative protease